MEPKNANTEEMKDALCAVKDLFGSDVAKTLIQSFGVQRLAEVPEQFHQEVGEIARKMMTAVQRDGETPFNAEKILVEHVLSTRQRWGNQPPSERVGIDQVLTRHRAHNGGVVQHAAVGHRLSPNDIIATLLDIAIAAQRAVEGAPARTADQASADYRALADAFAPLQQLPGPLSLTPAERAKMALITFVQATSVTIAGKEALEGIMAAMDAAVPGFTQAGGALEMVPNNGWVIAQQTVVTMPDGKKELGYTLLSGLGVFTDEADASKSLAELQLPLGYVIMSVEQLLPGYIMPLLDDAVGLEKPVNEVYAVRNYDDAYVEQLSVAVADLASDGKRFRTMIWLIEQGMSHEDRFEALTEGAAVPLEGEALENYMAYISAEAIMAAAQPETLEQFRAALDDVYRAGVLPNMDAKAVDTAKAHDVLRGDALKLAGNVVANYQDNHGRCIHCETVVEDLETIEERHAADCAVSLARQLIENES